MVCSEAITCRVCSLMRYKTNGAFSECALHLVELNYHNVNTAHIHRKY
jgi:hypothetical protein